MTGKTLSPLFSWRSCIVDSDLPAPARHIALTLSMHMSERGDSCFPSHATLAAETGLSASTICTHLKTLEERGFIEREPGTKGQSTRYRATPSDGYASRRGTPSDGDEVVKDQEQELKPFAAAPRERKPAKRNIVWDALVETCGEPSTASEKSDFGKTVSELKQVIPEGATLDDVRQAMGGRRTRWVQRFPDAAFTHRVLRTHWSDLGYGLRDGRDDERHVTRDEDLEDDGTGHRTF